MGMEKCILVVDDEEDLRYLLTIFLTDLGYGVLTAANGREGLAAFRDRKPAVVLSDIKMPEMDGIELLRRIKADSPEAEVIMITGHGDMDLAIESLKLEATDFITKPINHDILQISLKRAFERIRMRCQLREYTENLESLVRQKSARLVEMERATALGQAVECLTTAFLDIAGDVDAGMAYFNEVPCFVAIHDRSLQVVAANRLYEQRLGGRLGSPSWEIYASAFNRPEDCPAGRTFETGKAQRCREILRYREGPSYPVMVHTAPIRNSKGELELVLEISADISEIVRLQKDLRATQHRYHQLFEEVPCYIAVVDRDYRITAANRLFREDFGNEAGATCHHVCRQRPRPCPQCPAARSFADGRSHHQEMTATARNGRPLNLLIWTAPITNAAGEVVQVMEMATNITQIRRLQDRLSSLGLMVSSVSHGVKGVLTGMDAGLYMLQSGLEKEKPHQIQEACEVLKLMTERIRSVVLNLLHYTKDRRLNVAQTDVAEFLNDVAFIIRPKAEAHGVDLACHYEAPVGRFAVDPVALPSRPAAKTPAAPSTALTSVGAGQTMMRLRSRSGITASAWTKKPGPTSSTFFSHPKGKREPDWGFLSPARRSAAMGAPLRSTPPPSRVRVFASACHESPPKRFSPTPPPQRPETVLP